MRGSQGVFPAYAGVIPLPDVIEIDDVGFPRIRGGDPVAKRTALAGSAVFPASAGVILVGSLPIRRISGFPRIRGGDPWAYRYFDT